MELRICLITMGNLGKGFSEASSNNFFLTADQKIILDCVLYPHKSNFIIYDTNEFKILIHVLANYDRIIF